MADPSVLLVAMPWEVLSCPPLQLGTLRSVLSQAGIRTEVRSFKLAFVEHCLSATAGYPAEQQIGVEDYHRIGRDYYDGSLSDWIFAVHPFRDTSDLDEAYFESLRRRGVPEPDLAKAVAMRALVPGFLERCVDELLAVGPTVVGFMLPQSQANPQAYSQSVPSLALSKVLKTRDPAARILFGGVNCAGPMGAALLRSFPWIDVVVRGEAELVLPAVVQDLLVGRPIRPRPGLCYREGGQPIVVEEGAGPKVPMDEIPTPNHEEYFERLETTSYRAHILPQVSVLYESSRGCWWGEKSPCAFCGLNGTGMEFRSKRPERVVDELVTLASAYGQLGFTIMDNIMDAGYVRELLPRLRDSGYDFRIFYEVKSDLRKEEIRLLRQAGVDRIQPGIESLSTAILKLMWKGVTGFQNIRLLKWCAEFGVDVSWNLLYGVPNEQPAEYEWMADVMRSLTHLHPPQLIPIWLDRFSPYFERPGDFGLEILGPTSHARVVYPVDQATLSDLVHSFEFRRTDGCDPESYVGGVREVLADWTANHAAGFRSLRYHRGPGFLRIVDRRPNLPARDSTLGEAEALIYLACDDGATPAEARDRMRAAGIRDVGVAEVRGFLDELVRLRLVYHENGRYLALALSAQLPEPASTLTETARGHNQEEHPSGQESLAGRR